MSGFVKVLKSIYSFFAGDYLILSMSLIAFVVAGLMTHFAGNIMPLTVVVFLVLIVGGLVLSLARELGWRRKAD